MDVSKSINLFADSLFKLAIADGKSENVLVSPFSIVTCLSMLMNGTRRHTREQLLNALKIPSDIQVESVNDYYQNLLSSLKSVGDEKLLVNNLALISQSHSQIIKSDFQGVLKVKYNSQVQQADFAFAGDKVMQSINSWTNDSTNGLIPKLLEKAPPVDTVLMLLNSVYFEAKWMNKFGPNSYTRTFSIDDNTKEEVTFMSVTDSFNYSEVSVENFGLVKMIQLPYQGNTSMVIALPPNSTTVDSLITSNSMLNLIEEFTTTKQTRYVNLHMPKFKFDTKIEMQNLLTRMGVGEIFTSKADLTGISEAEGLHVTSITHATAIEVSEKGTKAAAVTSISFGIESVMMRPERPIELICDRPFVFMIYQDSANVPIFTGKLYKPQF